MLSAPKIEMSVSSNPDEQGPRCEEEAGLEAKNNCLDSEALLPHAVPIPRDNAAECVEDLQKPSQKFRKKMPGPVLNKALFVPLRILIVDDMPLNRKILARILEKDYRCEFASNGKEAFEKYLEKDFDIIFMDIQMPVMDGLEATIAIRQQEFIKHKRRTPIIALTAIGPGALDQGITLAAGMDGYITKPYGEKRIRETIRLHIGKGERLCQSSEREMDDRPLTSNFLTKKILRNSSPTRRASSPELSTHATTNSLRALLGSDESKAGPSSLEPVPTENLELLSVPPGSTSSDEHELLARFHLLHHENSDGLAQDLLSELEVTTRKPVLEKSF
jgi:CheY-like chemotaxis protein